MRPRFPQPAPTEGGIPKNILQFWHDKKIIPYEMRKALEGTRNSNPDFALTLADDEAIRNLLRARYDRTVQALYELIRLPSSRSDLARFVLLLEYGGFYLDVSMKFHVSLNTYLAGNPELILVRRDDVPKYADQPENATVMSGIIGAPARSPFIESCLQVLVANLVSGRYNTKAWWATGPGVLNRVLQTYPAGRPVRKLSFKEMRGGAVAYLRSHGVSNVWTKKQKDGIIDPTCYVAGSLVLDNS